MNKCAVALVCGVAVSILSNSPRAYATSDSQDFQQCQHRIKEQAVTQGFSDNIVALTEQLTPIKRVLTLDKKQPEFAESFAQYVNKRVSHYHVNKGRELLKSHKKLFSQLQEKYGIPPQYLVSFWGLETVFGRHKGKMSVLNALATLACDQRRSEYFTDELFDLFHLIDQGVVSTAQLKGSWAGAMGHMQFMPSALRKYALDGDQDGKVDVWQSEQDALTSAANYLNQIGWHSNERWGREVLLPEDFDFSAIEFDQRYPLATFAKMGVTKLNGQALPQYDTQAELVLPNGHQGHAFLVYQNFDVIMNWNLSKNYALSVGILADKLVGGQGVRKLASAKPLAYSRVQLERLQAKLNALGFDSGEPDGIWGPNSRKAIRAFQIEQQLIADGFPNKEVFERLGLLQS
ncbi:lytic transglycosylase [Thalassotalea insulae]|uniref:Lytic transglycosylase n=1 Tax=Thalassotalea insulae TaxID=2056778 RepID=A0ABQ6GV59_9GAMM|nr:lytic murein transglycosylase [Thalassotalea insulae]GLX79826.1 lytic transglycosylase [Thalassotalea insulae]